MGVIGECYEATNSVIGQFLFFDFQRILCLKAFKLSRFFTFLVLVGNAKSGNMSKLFLLSTPYETFFDPFTLFAIKKKSLKRTQKSTCPSFGHNGKFS